MIPAHERVLARVVEINGCWVFTGKAHNGKGYGIIARGRRGEGIAYVHRVVYEALVGPIPEGLTLDHLCHNDSDCPGGASCQHRRCVNPAHLEPVSRGLNVMRGEHPRIVLHREGRCIRGHKVSEKNTYFRPSGRVGWCRICVRERRAVASALLTGPDGPLA